MMQQPKRKSIAWGLIIALLNLVLTTVPGGMVLAAKGGMQHSSGPALVMAGEGCHELPSPSSALEMAMIPMTPKGCPDCENGCSLCFQIPYAIPSQHFTAVSKQQFFMDVVFPRLTQFNPDLLVPPPRTRIV